jgi:hypothetical protein
MGRQTISKGLRRAPRHSLSLPSSHSFSWAAGSLRAQGANPARRGRRVQGAISARKARKGSRVSKARQDRQGRRGSLRRPGSCGPNAARRPAPPSANWRKCWSWPTAAPAVRRPPTSARTRPHAGYWRTRRTARWSRCACARRAREFGSHLSRRVASRPSSRGLPEARRHILRADTRDSRWPGAAGAAGAKRGGKWALRLEGPREDLREPYLPSCEKSAALLCAPARLFRETSAEDASSRQLQKRAMSLRRSSRPSR